MKKSSVCIWSFVLSLLWATGVSAETVEIRGRIENGTRNSPAKAEELSLVRPGSGGMQVLHSLQNAGPAFSFTVEKPSGPLLLRASYAGESYTLMIPPVPERLAALQKMTVYDAGAKAEDLQITAAMHVSKGPAGLHVTKIYAITNVSSPPATFRGGAFTVPVFSGAKNIQGRIEYESTRMPLPLELLETEEGLVVDRAFRPGAARLSVEFDVEGVSFSDRMHTIKGFANPSPHNFTVLIWQPSDARPRVSGGSVTEVQIPDLGPALRVDYPAQGEVSYDVSAGSSVSRAPVSGPNVDANPIFDTTAKTLFGLLAALALFFLLAAFFSSLNIRVVRR